MFCPIRKAGLCWWSRSFTCWCIIPFCSYRSCSSDCQNVSLGNWARSNTEEAGCYLWEARQIIWLITSWFFNCLVFSWVSNISLFFGSLVFVDRMVSLNSVFFLVGYSLTFMIAKQGEILDPIYFVMLFWFGYALCWGSHMQGESCVWFVVYVGSHMQGE